MSVREQRSRFATLGRRSLNGLLLLSGYGLSILLMAAATLAAVPAMVHASGPEAVAAILVGQAIGAVAAVVIHYGWAITGPVRVARASRRGQLVDYVESLHVRTLLFVPVSLGVTAAATVIAPSHSQLAALGAFSASSIGFTANWYFVGLNRPYLMLLLETMPRVAGTVAGIALMTAGFSAAAGLWGQFAGMMLALTITTAWVLLRGDRPEGWRQEIRPVRAVLGSQWAGVPASAIPAIYAALPITLVGAVNPAALPSFAILDKFSKQVSVALTPVVTVFQGWVPRATGAQMRVRVRQSLLATVGLALMITVGVALLGQPMLDWMAAGKVPIPPTAILLTAVNLGVALFGFVLTRACLVPMGRVRYVSRITAASAVVGLVMVLALTPSQGVTGAAAALLAGSLVKVSLGLLPLRNVEGQQGLPAVSGALRSGSDPRPEVDSEASHHHRGT